MIIPASIGFKGTYDIVLRDTITGKIKDKRKIDNMLLNGFKRFLLDGMLGLEEIDTRSSIYIGTDNTPPSRSDTGIKGTTLASNRGTLRTSSPSGYPFTLTKTVTFPAGVGTGSIGEIVLRKDLISPYYGISRIALDPKIDKTDTDELIITYTLTAYRSADVISGTIPGGQRDGVTDINWKLTINNEQLYYFLYSRPYDDNNYNFYRDVALGDSNADSDLINDKHDTLKGNQIANFTPFHREWLPYSSENDYRDLVLGFEKDQGKGNIAEIVLIKYIRLQSYPYKSYNGVCRVTFDPPLDNTDPNYRLYLTLRFYIELGEETDVTIEGNNNNG